MNQVFFVNSIPPNNRQKIDSNYQMTIDNVIKYSIDLGFKYTLLTVGDKRIDPWVLAQYCLQKNNQFSPLVAVNPFYQHPMSIVKKIISLKSLYSSKIAINIVTGSFFNELKAVNDNLDFLQRKDRLLEFHQSILALTDSSNRSYKGNIYQVESLEMYPKYDFEPMDFFVSGALSSELSFNNETHFVSNIKPLNEMNHAKNNTSGLFLGICSRATKNEAIQEMARLFPDDRKGEMLFKISLSNNETPWNKWLKSYLDKNNQDQMGYSLQAMKNFWSSSPYIIGSYNEVAEAIKSYTLLGYKFFILDFLPEEAPHIKKCLEVFNSL